MKTIFRWFASGTVRQAVDLARLVRKHLAAQRDILSPEAILAIEKAIAELRQTYATSTDKKAILDRMKKLEDAANHATLGLKPYPHPSLRENIEVVLVALAVAMAIRTFFLQPFKIPTGSMQPTLFGVVSQNLKRTPDIQIPTGWARVR